MSIIHGGLLRHRSRGSGSRTKTSTPRYVKCLPTSPTTPGSTGLPAKVLTGGQMRFALANR